MTKIFLRATLALAVLCGLAAPCSAASLNSAQRVLLPRAVVTLPPPRPILLESFETLTGFTSAGGTQVLDTVRKVQGASSLKLSGNGTAGTNPIATKTGIANLDPAGLGVVAGYFRIADEAHRQVNGVQMRLGRGGTYYSGPNLSIGVGRPSGGYWAAIDASEIGMSGLGAGTIDLRAQINQQTVAGYATYANAVSFDALYANAKGPATVLLTFDDAEDTAYTIAYPLMAARNLKGTIYLPRDSVGLNSTKLSAAQVQTLYANDWDVANDGRTDDQPMTSAATLADAIANINSNRSYLVANGWTRAADHFCYPNGVMWGDASGALPVPLQSTAMTATAGSAAVTFGSAVTGLTAGMTAYGFGVPPGTIVSSVAGDNLSAVLSNPIAAGQTKPAIFIDQSGEFYMGKPQAALAAAGYKTGRQASGNDIYTRFGFGDQALMLPDKGTDNPTFADLKPLIDTALLRGTTLVLHWHRLDESVTGASIRAKISVFTAVLDYIVAARNAGLLQILTISELWARDGAATVPATLNYLLRRDLGGPANDNRPAFLDRAA